MPTLADATPDDHGTSRDIDPKGRALLHFRCGVAFAWISALPGIAAVSSAGLVTGVAVGTTTVTASAGGIQAGAVVNVTNPSTLLSLVVTPAVASVARRLLGQRLRQRLGHQPQCPAADGTRLAGHADFGELPRLQLQVDLKTCTYRFEMPAQIPVTLTESDGTTSTAVLALGDLRTAWIPLQENWRQVNLSDIIDAQFPVHSLDGSFPARGRDFVHPVRFRSAAVRRDRRAQRRAAGNRDRDGRLHADHVRRSHHLLLGFHNLRVIEPVR